MDKTMKVAAIQMNCTLGQIEKNLEQAEALIVSAANAGAKLIVLPELFDTGYRVEERDAALASTIPGRTTDYLARLCKNYQVFVAGALLEELHGNIYDTAFIIGPEGVIGTYHKTALWGPEKERFVQGDADYRVFDIGLCKVGILICYEIGFPECARALALKGADILLYSSAFGALRYYAWDIASRARALENGVFVIASNRTGIEKEETAFGGHSRIVNPQGTILCEAVNEYEVIVADIDLNQISEQRSAIPYLKDLGTVVQSK